MEPEQEQQEQNKVKKKMEWHQLLGMGLTDYMTDSYYEVETEIDLSLKQQRLDIVVLRKKEGKPLEKVCDGFENLKDHNLITFKSFQDQLNNWALNELVGHYVNYRKQRSPSEKKLIPTTDFQLYGISARLPKQLFQEHPPQKIKDGVYDLLWGSMLVRIIVLCEIQEELKNALWYMFVGDKKKMIYGVTHYQWKQSCLQILLNDLYRTYLEGGIPMAYTVDDFLRDSCNPLGLKLRQAELQREKERQEKMKERQEKLKEREEKIKIQRKNEEILAENERLRKLLEEKK